MQEIYELAHLTCANCGGRIERAVAALEEVKEANLDLVGQKLYLERESGAGDADLSPQIQAISDRIEPGLTVRRLSPVPFSIVPPSDLEEDVGAQPTCAAQVKEVKSLEEEEEEEEEAEASWPSLLLGGALFVLALLVDHVLHSPFSLLFYLSAYVIAGHEVLLMAFKGLFSGQVFSEFFLMSIATLGALAIGQYPEAVAVMLFYLLGEILQDRAVDHSRKSIQSLLAMKPTLAHRVGPQGVEDLAPEEVQVGELLLVKVGERVPLDGRIVEGHSFVDTSALTGESRPRAVKEGDSVLSGFINQEALLRMEVEKPYDHSTFRQIMTLVEHASARKAPTEKFISRFARYYTPVVVFAALALAILPPLLITNTSFTPWIYRALIFLVISCPCALVISVPLGFFGGIGGASKEGILIKGGNYLEALRKVDMVVFDKTGTLTKGVFALAELVPEAPYEKADLLEALAYIEAHSNHPIARSIQDAYQKKVDLSKIDHYREIAGKGLAATVSGHNLQAGNALLMQDQGLSVPTPEETGTLVYLSVDGHYAGYARISDELKEDAAQAMDQLRALGVQHLVMLTGDNHQVGEAIGRSLSLDRVYADLLPADKVQAFEKLAQERKDKGSLVYVGDGINDAPVLARADVGIAMGALGSDAAIEAADVVLLTDEPVKLAQAIRIALKTNRIVRENVFFALFVKALFLLLGALGLANMWSAVFADVGVALLCVLNSMRTLRPEK